MSLCNKWLIYHFWSFWSLFLATIVDTSPWWILTKFIQMQLDSSFLHIPQCASHLLPQGFSTDAEVWKKQTPSWCQSLYIPEFQGSNTLWCKPLINEQGQLMDNFSPFLSLSSSFSHDFSKDGSLRSSKQSLLAVNLITHPHISSLAFYAPLSWVLVLLPGFSLSNRCMHIPFGSGPDVWEPKLRHSISLKLF